MKRACVWGLRLALTSALFALAMIPLRLAHAQPSPVYQWRSFADDDSQVALVQLRGGAWVQVGGYSYDTETYRPRDGDGWGEACEAPIAPPERLRNPPRLRNARNFGVDERRVGKGPRYRINGKEVSRAEAVDAIEKGTVPDDSRRLRLTLIGSAADRAPVEADLKSPTLAPIAAKLAVQSYAPDAWAVARFRFVTSGKPTIYLQEPNGKVRWRIDEYPGAAKLAAAIRAELPAEDAEGLKEAKPVQAGPEQKHEATAKPEAPAPVEAMRNPHPDYDPAADPRPDRPNLIPALIGLPPDYKAAGMASALVLAVVGIRSIRSRKKGA